MVVYYASRSIPNKTKFRSTLSSLWLVLGVFLATSHYLGGHADAQTYAYSGMLLAPLIGGIVLGEILHDKIPQERFRLLVMFLLVFAGAALMLRPE